MKPSGAFRRIARQRWAALGSLVLLALCIVLQLVTASAPSRSAVPNRVDALLYDWRFQLLPPQRHSHIPIVVVDLDEFTQQREGR